MKSGLETFAIPATRECQKTPACYAPRSPQGKNDRQRAGSASPEGQCVPAAP